MIEAINQAWNWNEIKATEIISTNDFGNIIFKTDQSDYWRICPEELSCSRIAADEKAYEEVSNEAVFKEDWEMASIVNIAKTVVGELGPEEVYCLKMPGVLGGAYDEHNMGKIGFLELISYSGKLAFQIKDLRHGQKVEIDASKEQQ